MWPPNLKNSTFIADFFTIFIDQKWLKTQEESKIIECVCVLEYVLDGGGKPKIETFMETILDEIIDSYII